MKMSDLSHREPLGNLPGPRIHCETMVGFFLVGIIASALDISVLVMLSSWFGVGYLAAAVVSYCCGIMASYLLNKSITFHNTDRHFVSQFSTFAAISVSCLLVNLSIIWLAVELFSLNFLTGKIIATLVAFFWNYHGQKRYTFQRQEMSG